MAGLTVTGPPAGGNSDSISLARTICVVAGITIGRSSEMRGKNDAMIVLYLEEVSHLACTQGVNRGGETSMGVVRARKCLG